MSIILSTLMGGYSIASQDIDADLTTRTEQLFAPEYDLLEVKLMVDTVVDPKIDAQQLKTTIGHMVDSIRDMAGEDATNAAKLAALKRYLYESGDWNDHEPFRYDLDDPLGEKPENRLLQRYLTTKRGNCITMPMLMVFLGQRLGLRMTMAEAPLHVFVKYADDEGKVFNLEATSGGGVTRDVWYRQKLPMSDAAVTNGVYLRPLSHEEATALIASFLVEHQQEAGAFENAITVSNVLLRHYPNFAYALVKKGSAYSGLLRRELAGKYTRMEDIPADLKAKADEWYGQNMQAFAQAEAIGWRPEDGQTQ